MAAIVSNAVAADQANTSISTKHIIVLGASYTGIPVTHNILRHVVPALPDPATYHVTLVDPSMEWYSRVGAPRGIVSEELLPLNKLFFSIPDAFKNYPKETFTFLQGRATKWDYRARNVEIVKANGSVEVLDYYALVIATGSATSTPILGSQGAHTLSLEAIEAFRKKLPEARSVVIAGGGPAGVEVAGEIGQFLNGAAGFFATRPSDPKAKITVVTSDSKLLPALRPSLGIKAEKLLNRVGVDVIYNNKVESTVPETAGRLDDQGGLSTLLEPAKVKLSNGETLEADLFIPAWGLKPNSSWIPVELLTSNGQVDVSKSTLRVDNAGPRVYAIGDIANYGQNGLIEVMNAMPVVNVNIKRDLLHDAKVAQTADANEAITGKDNLFEDKIGESQLVPIGRNQGVGAVFGWQLPSLMVYMIKGRDYLASTYPDTMNGKSVNKEVKWAYA